VSTIAEGNADSNTGETKLRILAWEESSQFDFAGYILEELEGKSSLILTWKSKNFTGVLTEGFSLHQSVLMKTKAFS